MRTYSRILCPPMMCRVCPLGGWGCPLTGSTTRDSASPRPPPARGCDGGVNTPAPAVTAWVGPQLAPPAPHPGPAPYPEPPATLAAHVARPLARLGPRAAHGILGAGAPHARALLLLRHRRDQPAAAARARQRHIGPAGPRGAGRPAAHARARQCTAKQADAMQCPAPWNSSSRGRAHITPARAPPGAAGAGKAGRAADLSLK